MGKINRTGFGASLLDAIDKLGVVEGEVDNIMESAIRDIAENLASTMAKGWPRGERKYPSQRRPHSATRWTAKQIEKLMWEVRNDADYADYVHNHPNQGGPPGLADRVIPGLLQQIDDEPLRFVTARVFELIASGA